MFDTATQGLAPSVAMETPLGSGADRTDGLFFYLCILRFLCKARRQTSHVVGRVGRVVGPACLRRVRPGERRVGQRGRGGQRGRVGQ